MLRRTMQWAGRALKGDSFSIDPGVTTVDLIEFAAGRAAMTLRGLLRRPWLRYGSRGPHFIGERVRIFGARRVRLDPGVTLHREVTIQGASSEGVTLGKGVSIGAYSTIAATSVLRNLGVGCSIGEGSGLGEYCFIGCGDLVTIGRNVIMGQYVSFHTERHLTDRSMPIRDQGVRREAIVIEDDVWVGAKATFLPGAYVEAGCIVAAGAVVRGRVAANSIVGGVPARVIGERG